MKHRPVRLLLKKFRNQRGFIVPILFYPKLWQVIKLISKFVKKKTIKSTIWNSNRKHVSFSQHIATNTLKIFEKNTKFIKELYKNSGPKLTSATALIFHTNFTWC